MSPSGQPSPVAIERGKEENKGKVMTSEEDRRGEAGKDRRGKNSRKGEERRREERGEEV